MSPDEPPQGYGDRQAPGHHEQGEGCLTVAVRIPVRIVVLLLFVPLRMVWDVLVVSARALDRVLLRPLGRGLGWLGRVVCVVPLVWLYETLLTPSGHAVVGLLRAVFAWPWVVLWRYVVVPLVRYGVVVPLVWVSRTVLLPLGRAAAWLLTRAGHGLAFLPRGLLAALGWVVLVLLVIPVSWLYRRIIAPAGREIGAAIVIGRRLAGYVSRAVGRAVGRLCWNVLGRPARWTYRTVCTPVGHLIRDSVCTPAREAAAGAAGAGREAFRVTWEMAGTARSDAWRALAGPPRQSGPGEPSHDRARTLGSTTTVPGAVPAPEISLQKQG